MCRAVDEKIVVRVHDFRPDVKKVVREGREVKRCITEEYRLFTHMSCIILYPYSTYPCRG